MGFGQEDSASRQTFTKADRLLQRSDFIHLAKCGRRYQNRYFIAQVCINKSKHCRLGLTVSRKVAQASERNRLKRIAREYFRQKRQVLKGHWDINLIARKKAADLTNKNVVTALESIFRKIADNEKE